MWTPQEAEQLFAEGQLLRRSDIMKRAADYTDQELLELYDNGQLRTLVDLECAHQGIPLLPEEPLKPIVEEVTPDKTVYCLRGTSLVFDSLENANSTLQLFGSMTVYNSDYAPGGNYDQKVVKPVSLNDIDVQKVFSRELWDAHRKKVKEGREALEKYEESIKAYNSILEKRDIVKEEILERIEDYRNYLYRREEACRIFDRYLQLAEGNETIAGNFMKAAHSLKWDEFKDELVSDKATAAGQNQAEQDVAG